MGDVRWYDEEPKGSDLDVALWHPYSSEPVTRGGNWDINASPTDLLNIGKYIGGGLSKLLGLGGLPEMPGTFGGTAGVGAGVTGAGTLDLSGIGAAGVPAASAAALPGALSAYAPASELMGGAGFLGSGAGTLGATGAGAAGVGAGVTGAAAAGDLGLGAGAAVGGGSALGGAGAASSLLPGLGVAAAPLAIVALAKLLSGNGPHDPEQAARTQFGTPNPTLQAFQDYLGTPEKDRKVDLMAMRDVNGYMGPEHFNAWKNEASRAGLWDLANNRWNTSSVVDGDRGPVDATGEGIRYQTLDDIWSAPQMTPSDYSGWNAFTRSSDYIPEDQRPGAPTGAPAEVPNPGGLNYPDTQVASGDTMRMHSMGGPQFQGEVQGPYSGLEQRPLEPRRPTDPSMMPQPSILTELLKRWGTSTQPQWAPRDYNTWQQA